MKTKQETFNIVANHLLTQNRQSLNEIGLCMYRGPDNLKCAIGCLIADEDYYPAMEHNNIAWLLEKGYLKKFLDHIVLLEELRKVHDNRHPTMWKKALDEISYEHNLTMVAV